MDKNKVSELFEELLKEFKSSKTTVIYEYSTDEEKDFLELDEKIEQYRKRLNDFLK